MSYRGLVGTVTGPRVHQACELQLISPKKLINMGSFLGTI